MQRDAAVECKAKEFGGADKCSMQRQMNENNVVVRNIEIALTRFEQVPFLQDMPHAIVAVARG